AGEQEQREDEVHRRQRQRGVAARVDRVRLFLDEPRELLARRQLVRARHQPIALVAHVVDERVARTEKRLHGRNRVDAAETAEQKADHRERDQHRRLLDHGAKLAQDRRMLIADNKVVLLDYTLKNASGEVLDSSEGGEPLAYL